MPMDIPHFEKHSYDHSRRPENLLFGTHEMRVVGPDLELVRTTMPLAREIPGQRQRFGEST